MGGTLTMDGGYQTLYGELSDRIKPFTILMGMHNAAASVLVVGGATQQRGVGRDGAVDLHALAGLQARFQRHQLAEDADLLRRQVQGRVGTWNATGFDGFTHRGVLGQVKFDPALALGQCWEMAGDLMWSAWW